MKPTSLYGEIMMTSFMFEQVSIAFAFFCTIGPAVPGYAEFKREHDFFVLPLF